jgi:hypothetical protein
LDCIIPPVTSIRNKADTGDQFRGYRKEPRDSETLPLISFLLLKLVFFLDFLQTSRYISSTAQMKFEGHGEPKTNLKKKNSKTKEQNETNVDD